MKTLPCAINESPTDSNAPGYFVAIERETFPNMRAMCEEKGWSYVVACGSHGCDPEAKCMEGNWFLIDQVQLNSGAAFGASGNTEIHVVYIDDAGACVLCDHKFEEVTEDRQLAKIQALALATVNPGKRVLILTHFRDHIAAEQASREKALDDYKSAMAKVGLQ